MWAGAAAMTDCGRVAPVQDGRVADLRGEPADQVGSPIWSIEPSAMRPVSLSATGP